MKNTHNVIVNVKDEFITFTLGGIHIWRQILDQVFFAKLKPFFTYLKPFFVQPNIILRPPMYIKSILHPAKIILCLAKTIHYIAKISFCPPMYLKSILPPPKIILRLAKTILRLPKTILRLAKNHSSPTYIDLCT